MRISSNMSMMLLDAGTVGAEADAHALAQQVGQRGDAAARLGVALGAVRHGGVLRLEDADVVDAGVHAVHGEEVVVEDAPLLQVLDRAHAVGLDEHALPAHLLAVVVGELAGAGADVGDLLLAFGDVAGDLHAALAGVGREALEEAARDRVGRVRARCRSRTAAGPAPAAFSSRSSRSASVSSRRVSSMPKTSR